MTQWHREMSAYLGGVFQKIMEKPKVKQLRPCLMADYGCHRKALAHLFCPVHWGQIHLDDREALDDPAHKRCVTFGVDAATGQMAYMPDKDKHRAIAGQVVNALAQKEEEERARLAGIDALHAAQAVEIRCAKCQTVNIKWTALGNSCGACGEKFPAAAPIPVRPESCVPAEQCSLCNPGGDNNGICYECATMAPDGDNNQTGMLLPEFDSSADPFEAPRGSVRWFEENGCEMCGIGKGERVPDSQARCGQCGRGI